MQSSRRRSSAHNDQRFRDPIPRTVSGIRLLSCCAQALPDKSDLPPAEELDQAILVACEAHAARVACLDLASCKNVRRPTPTIIIVFVEVVAVVVE